MIRAEIEVPHTVMVPRGRKTVTVDVVCRLHNVGEHSYVMSSAAGEEPHFWHLLNSRQREVQRSRPGKQAEAHACHMVAAGCEEAHPEQVTLDASKLKHGQTYTLRFRLMGRSAEADFTVFHPRERKQAARKKASRTKAGKKTAGKRTASKKVARQIAKRKTAAMKAVRKKPRRKPARKTGGKKKTAQKMTAGK